MPALNIPHDFELLRIGQRPPILTAGSGLSFGLVPIPNKLLELRKDGAETALKCTPLRIDPTEEGALYLWAEQILAQLESRAHIIPKLKLAEALGLLSEPCWTAETGLPLRGTTPRHRVIARLAREERWVSIWSFNWDTHIENALEKIGFDRDEPTSSQPWTTAYRTIVIDEDFPHLARNDLFCILKPHGCVRALVRARELLEEGDTPKAAELASRFLITETELILRPTSAIDRKFYMKLSTSLVESPLMIVGWSISEPYLASVINDTITTLIHRSRVEELTIVDPKFNTRGHTKAAECYDLTRDQVFAELQPEAGHDTDNFFLWLQARYALDQIASHASASSQTAIASITKELVVPFQEHFLLAWADDFLPAWIRLCWRADLVPCAGFQLHQIRMELEDFHIPWKLTGVLRPDLSAAAELLSLIVSSTQHWDYSHFPGALFRKEDGRLVLPLPNWGSDDKLPSLRRSLVALFAVLDRQFAYVTRLDVLLLDQISGRSTASPERAQLVKEMIASMIRVKKFASPDNINIVTDLGA